MIVLRFISAWMGFDSFVICLLSASIHYIFPIKTIKIAAKEELFRFIIPLTSVKHHQRHEQLGRLFKCISESISIVIMIVTMTTALWSSQHSQHLSNGYIPIIISFHLEPLIEQRQNNADIACSCFTRTEVFNVKQKKRISKSPLN